VVGVFFEKKGKEGPGGRWDGLLTLGTGKDLKILSQGGQKELDTKKKLLL